MGVAPGSLHPMQHLLRPAVNRGGLLKMDMTHNFCRGYLSCFKLSANTLLCAVQPC